MKRAVTESRAVTVSSNFAMQINKSMCGDGGPDTCSGWFRSRAMALFLQIEKTLTKNRLVKCFSGAAIQLLDYPGWWRSSSDNKLAI
jgi:hypothetical protein